MQCWYTNNFGTLLGVFNSSLCVLGLSCPPAVEFSIAVEHAAENPGLYRVFVLCFFQRVIDTLAPLSRG